MTNGKMDVRCQKDGTSIYTWSHLTLYSFWHVLASCLTHVSNYNSLQNQNPIITYLVLYFRFGTSEPDGSVLESQLRDLFLQPGVIQVGAALLMILGSQTKDISICLGSKLLP